MLVETALQQPVTDLWGVAIPAWVGAVGTVAAAIIGVVALLRSNSAVGGVRVLRNGLRTTAEDTAKKPPQVMEDEVPVIMTEAEAHGHAAWSLEVGDSGQATLVSESWDEVELLEISPSAGLQLTLHFNLPTNVPSGAPIRFIVHRILGGPAVRSITVRSKSKDGQTHSQVFFL